MGAPLSTSYESLERIRAFIIQEPIPSVMPDPLELYESDLVAQYESVCGESLGAQSGVDGRVIFQNFSAEKRFAQSLGGFLSNQWRITAQNSLLRSSLLRLYYRRHLNDGTNCPEGSPARLRQTLGQRYEEISTVLSFAVSVQRSHGISEDVDAGWDEFLKDDDQNVGSVSMPRSRDYDLELKTRISATMESIQGAIRDPQTDGDILLIFEILVNILTDSSRQGLGYKLLGLIEMRSIGTMVVKDRFAELVSAVDGGFTDPLFYAFIDALKRSEGEGYDLLRRLWVAISVRPLNDTRRAFAQKVLAKVGEGNLPKAAQIVELLEDKVEADYMDISSDPRTYMAGYKLRRSSGNSGGGSTNGSSLPPSSSLPPASSTPDITGFQESGEVGRIYYGISYPDFMGVFPSQPVNSFVPVVPWMVYSGSLMNGSVVSTICI